MKADQKNSYHGSHKAHKEIRPQFFIRPHK